MVEKSKKLNRVARTLLVTDQYSPASLRLFAALSFGLAVLGGYLAQAPGSAVPEQDALLRFKGELVKASKGEYGINLFFSDVEPSFRYHSKAAKMDAVWDAVYPGASIEILHKDSEKFGDILSVYQLAVDGEVIRSYDEIRQAYISDDKIGIWLGVVFFISGAYLLLTAHYTEKNQELLAKERMESEAGFN